MCGAAVVDIDLLWQEADTRSLAELPELVADGGLPRCSGEEVGHSQGGAAFARLDPDHTGGRASRSHSQPP